MKKCIVLVLLIISIVYQVAAQNTPYGQQPNPEILQDINQIDSAGRKQGLWVENNSEIYYKDGAMHGVAKYYHTAADGHKLSAFHKYKDGNDEGIWYYFTTLGHLYMTVVEQGYNKRLQVKRDDGIMLKPKYKCYIKIYKKDGSILEEGVGLYDESVEMDFFKYGKWKGNPKVKKAHKTISVLK